MRLKVRVSPNPFTSELVVSITSDVVLNAVLRLTDTNNNMVRMIGSPLHSGENNVYIKNLSKYVTGTYQLQIKLLNGEMLETIELVKE
jgi:hypothetical protein